jgi:hypothetical protein
MRNRVDDAGLATTRVALERELDGWLTRLDDQFLPPVTHLKRDKLTQFFEATMHLGEMDGALGRLEILHIGFRQLRRDQPHLMSE